MRVLAIGSDRSITLPNSASARRQVAYGIRLGDLRIIIFSLEDQRLRTFALSVETHVYPTGSTWRTLYGWSAFWIAQRLPKPDVVTTQDPFETGLIAWVIARVRRAKFHVQVHTDFLDPAFRRHSILNRLRAMLAGFIIRRADRIRVVSSRVKESIERRHASLAPITVLPIYVDVARFAHAHASLIAGRFSRFETKLVVVARLEKEKNVALAIESVAKTPEKTCLIIVGDGREKKRLESLAQKLGVSNRVFFEGAQDPAPYYALASLLLVPSVFEGYGLVILEALAAGKPVLATDVGVASEAGAIITSRENFSDALLAWIESGPRSASLGAYPYTTFDAYADAYAEDIEKTIETGVLQKS